MTTTNNNGDDDDDDEKSENDLERFLHQNHRSKKLDEKRTTSNKFGNGILQPRKEQIERGIDTIAAAIVPPLRINDVSHEDFELGAVATDPPLRFPKSLLSDLTISFACDLEKEKEETRTSVISRCDLNARDIRRKNKVMDAMLRGEPVLLRNSGVVGKLDAKFNADSKIGLAQVWNFDHLAKILGVPDDGGNGAPTHTWKCFVCPSDKHRFIEHDE